MDLRTIQAGGGGLGGALARLALAPLAWGYGAGVGLRNLLFDDGVRRVERLPVPVVSVGNLVAGGTGKTPFVALLVERLRARGRFPGVLSRGYGPRVPGGRSDEGAVLAHVCGAQLPQREDPDRARGGHALLAAHPRVDVLVLDDGFQHRRVARDLDVVLLDAQEPFGFGRLLPRGRLREPAAALARAGLVVLTRAERVDAGRRAALAREIGRLTRAPLVCVRTRPVALEADDAGTGLSALAGVPVLAFAGLGDPAAFETTLAGLGARVVARRFVADHAGLASDGWRALAGEARAAGARWIVITRKDAVKLAARPSGVAVLDVAHEVLDGEEHLERALDALALRSPD